MCVLGENAIKKIVSIKSQIYFSQPKTNEVSPPSKNSPSRKHNIQQIKIRDAMAMRCVWQHCGAGQVPQPAVLWLKRSTMLSPVSSLSPLRPMSGPTRLRRCPSLLPFCRRCPPFQLLCPLYSKYFNCSVGSGLLGSTYWVLIIQLIVQSRTTLQHYFNKKNCDNIILYLILFLNKLFTSEEICVNCEICAIL